MKISVCIATFNGERYIKQQLESILTQLNLSDEIIVSDDLSSDNTVSIIQSFNDDRIKIYSNQKFENLSLNFENALQHSTGDIIFLSDQDDVWTEKKVEKMVQLLNDYDLVISDFQVVDENLNIIEDNLIKKKNLSVLNIFYNNPYMGCCMAFNRNVLLRCLPFYAKMPMHDMWIGIIASLYFKQIFLNEKLLLYRRHSSNASFTSIKSQNSLIKKITFRINMLKGLLYAYIRRQI